MFDITQYISYGYEYYMDIIWILYGYKYHMNTNIQL